MQDVSRGGSDSILLKIYIMLLFDPVGKFDGAGNIQERHIKIINYMRDWHKTCVSFYCARLESREAGWFHD